MTEEALLKKQCAQAALRLLAMKSYFSFELAKKLLLKGFPKHLIDELIKDYTQKGFLGDAERMRSWVEREKKRGFGPYYIACKLKRLGWKENDLSFREAMNALRKEEPFLLKELLKKCGKKEGKSLVMFLERRGFSRQTIAEYTRCAYADRNCWD